MNERPDFRLSEIGQIALAVKDPRKSAEFYRDTLGMKFLFEAPNLAFFDCGGIRLMLGTAEKPEQVVYFRVADIQAAYQLLAGRGVKFEDKPHLVARMPDHELWMTFLRDPDGNLLALMSEVRKS